MSRSTFVKLSAVVLAAILLVVGGAGSVSVHANPLQATDTASATLAATQSAPAVVATTAATIAAPAAATTVATMAATAACPPVAAVDSAMVATMAASMAATMSGTSVATAAGTTSAFAPGFLGVAVSTAPDGCGSIIEEVVAGQAADKAGIKVNDEVIGADGKALTTSNALRDYVIAHNAGDTLNLSVLRGTGTPAIVIAVTLGTRPAEVLATAAATADTSSAATTAATPVATAAATAAK